MASSVSLLYQCVDLEADIKEQKGTLKVDNFAFEVRLMFAKFDELKRIVAKRP